MEIIINVPEYDRTKGLQLSWKFGFDVEVKIKNGVVILSANKTGLISLATQLLTLSQDEVPSHSHYHLDEYNSFEEGSSELIISKK